MIKLKSNFTNSYVQIKELSILQHLMETKQLGQSHKMHMQLLFKACMYRQYWTTASTILATKTKAKIKTFFHLKYKTFEFL